MWEEPGGAEKWVREMPEQILLEQFPTAPPIFLDRELAESFLEQARWREAEILRYDQQDLSKTFPQHFSECEPAFGAACPYRACCFQPWVRQAPLDSGLYIVRTPHHDTEEVG